MHIPYWWRVCIEVFWQTGAAQHNNTYLPTYLNLGFQPTASSSEADTLQLELSRQVNKGA